MDDDFSVGMFVGFGATSIAAIIAISCVQGYSYNKGVMDREDNKVVVITNPVGKREIYPVDKIIGDAKVTVEKKDAEEVIK